MDARALVRWGVGHGLVRVALRRAERAGDLHARSVLDPASRADPYPLYDEVRSHGPLLKGALAHLTASHAVASEVLRREDFRAGADEDAFPPLMGRAVRWSRDESAVGPIDPPSLLVVEPPDHTRYRRLVSKVFTARAVEQLRGDVERVADELLDDLARAGAGGRTVDLVEAYATLLPVTVIAHVLGVPREDRRTVLHFGEMAAPTLDVALSLREFREVDAGVRGFNRWLAGHLERLRRDPGDDLLSQLVALDELTDVELRATAGLLLAAGFETTVNLLGSGTELLLRHPDQRALLREDPSRWPGAVEEVLRFESPVQVTARFAKDDTELAGRALRAGSLVITMLGGANRDPDVFADPHRFDVLRPNAKDHLSFSGGRHFCLGAALARLEGEVGLRRLFERFPDLQAAGTPVRRGTRVLRGWKTLPVRPGQAVGVAA
ncbi:MAG TPA: cytochrome P450 [Mycobacteriales bacterium]|nr:cytochrome P450 [Mycobacteriales bacterium]